MSLPAAGVTETYNVYRVEFRQTRGSNHEGIALVPAQLEEQSIGRFYHVKGDVGMGMDYESKGRYGFGKTRSYEGSTLEFKMPSSYLSDFESIASGRPAPHDPRALMEAKPDPPVRDCSDWVDEVLAETKAFLKSKGIDV